MSLLHNNGYQVIPLGEAARLLSNGSNTGKFTVITFDDGYRDFMENAWPVMQQYDFPATVFISTDLVGCENEVFLNKSCLTWTEISTLHREGVEFGSHTVTHPKLDKLNHAELIREISESKNTLEDKLGVEITSFSCPYAFPNTPDFKWKYEKMLINAGYSYGVTTRIGKASVKDGLLTLKRIPVNDFDDPQLFMAKLNGGYDWVYMPQTAAKKLKRVLGRKTIK